MSDKKKPAAPASNKHYVYALVDPRDGQAFYIGKGCGRRAWMHERAARRGKVENAAKHERIRAIVDAGLVVRVELLLECVSERRALELEARIIASNAHLTNIAPYGVPSPDAVQLAKARDMLSRLRPEREANDLGLRRFVEWGLRRVVAHLEARC